MKYCFGVVSKYGIIESVATLQKSKAGPDCTFQYFYILYNLLAVLSVCVLGFYVPSTALLL